MNPCYERRSLLAVHVLSFAFALAFLGDFELLVISLEVGHIVTGVGELRLFHTFGNIPVDEGTLAEQKIEALAHVLPDVHDGGGVGDHQASTLDLSEVAAWDDGGWLVVDADLEAGWAPVDELDGSLGLDDGDGGVDVLWNDVTAVHHAARHVLALAWIALDHHVGGLEAAVGDFSDGELFVVRLLSRDKWGVGAEWEVDSLERNEVGLELRQIDVQSAVETEGSSDTRDHLSDDTVKVGVGAVLNVEVAVADIVHSLVIDHEGTVGVLKHAVGCEDGVVWLHDGDGNVNCWEDDELELGLSAVVEGDSLEQEGTETRTGTTTEGVEDDEALETSAVIGLLSDTVEDQINDVFTDVDTATGIVVGSVFLAGDQLLWVVDLAVGASADFIDNGWFQVDVDGSWNVLACAGFGEEGVEGVLLDTDRLVRWHLTVVEDTVLQAEELPAGVTHLATALTNMHADYFSHFEIAEGVWKGVG